MSKAWMARSVDAPRRAAPRSRRTRPGQIGDRSFCSERSECGIIRRCIRRCRRRRRRCQMRHITYNADHPRGLPAGSRPPPIQRTHSIPWTGGVLEVVVERRGPRRLMAAAKGRRVLPRPPPWGAGGVLPVDEVDVARGSAVGSWPPRRHCPFPWQRSRRLTSKEPWREIARDSPPTPIARRRFWGGGPLPTRERACTRSS